MLNWGFLRFTQKDLKNVNILCEIEQKLSSFKTEIIERSDISTCENCKCLVFKDNRFKGESEIKKRTIFRDQTDWYQEYIYTPYYCKRCYQEIQAKKVVESKTAKKTKTKK